jgi:hypothetical protein
MMGTSSALVGRVIRVGRGWADVTVDSRIRRVSTRPDLLVRAGNYLQIVNEHGVAILPADQSYSTTVVQ